MDGVKNVKKNANEQRKNCNKLQSAEIMFTTLFYSVWENMEDWKFNFK